MRICVTGASGRMGQVFLSLAAETPSLRIRALTRLARTLPPEDKVEWIVGDLSDPAICDNLLSDQDVLIHLAWDGVPLQTGEYAAGLNNGLVRTAQLLDAARRRNGLRIVFPSSGGTVYADKGYNRPHSEKDPCCPISPYAIQKLAAEHYLGLLCATGRVGVRVLRIATGYGWVANLSAQQGFIDTAIAAALAQKPIRLIGNPENVRDFIHCADIAKALLLAATKPLASGILELCNIGTGVGTSVHQVVELIREELGRTVTTHQEHWEGERNLPGYAVLDVARAREILGWAPSITIRQGIHRSLRDLVVPRKRAQSSINSRRFSNMSLRR